VIQSGWGCWPKISPASEIVSQSQSHGLIEYGVRYFRLSTLGALFGCFMRRLTGQRSGPVVPELDRWTPLWTIASVACRSPRLPLFCWIQICNSNHWHARTMLDIGWGSNRFRPLGQGQHVPGREHILVLQAPA